MSGDGCLTGHHGPGHTGEFLAGDELSLSVRAAGERPHDERSERVPAGNMKTQGKLRNITVLLWLTLTGNTGDSSNVQSVTVTVIVQVMLYVV